MTTILGHTFQDWEPESPVSGPPVPKWIAPKLPLKGLWPWVKAAVPPPPPSKAKWTITSTPTGATITINLLAAGVSPLTDVVLDPGTYTALAHKAGYVDQTKTVTLVAGQTMTTDFEMSGIVTNGTLHATSIPIG